MVINQHRLHERINHLVQLIGPRMAGSLAGKLACDYIREQMEASGAQVEVQTYACPAWACEEIHLSVAGEHLTAYPNPFSPSCDIRSIPVFVSTQKELEKANLQGRIVVLSGDLSSQVIACKSWFLIEPRDQLLLETLEQKSPAAILTVQNDPGSINRILEDWEVTIPSATIPAESALQILNHTDQPVNLRLVTRQGPGTSANLVVRIPGKSNDWIAIMAHHDTKIDTPGATDNGTGVVIVMELLDYYLKNPPDISLEFIVFGSEEYLPIGDDEYMRRAGEGHIDEILFVVNFDGACHRLGTDSLAAIGCSSEFSSEVGQIMHAYSSIIASDPWPESNHSTFTFRGAPALAFTSHSTRKYAHQLDDALRWVDGNKMVELVELTTRIIDETRNHPVAWYRKSD